MERICFSGIWNDREARFEQCFLPIVASAPALIAAAILLHQALGYLVTWRPKWTQPFVEEEIQEPQVDDDLLPTRRKWSIYLIGQLIITLIGFTIQLLGTIQAWPATESIVLTMSWFAISAMLLIHRPSTAPFAPLIIFALKGVAYIALIASPCRACTSFERSANIVSLCASMLGICLIVPMPLRHPKLSRKDISKPMTEPTSSLRSPEDDLTLFQFMTVTWMTPLIRLGYGRQLHDEDVWQLGYEFHHQRLHDKFRTLKGTVIRRLIKANAIDLCILAFLAILELVMQYSTPLLLQLLLSSMGDITAPQRSAFTYAALSLAVRLIAAQSGVFSLWFGRRCYERSRGEMITMLYEKTLGRKINFAGAEKPTTEVSNGHVTTNGHPSKDEQSPWYKQAWRRAVGIFKRKKETPAVKEPASMGKILNLMRNDVYEVAQRFWECQGLIQKPLSAIFSITLVVRFLGWPSLIVVAMLVLAQTINFLLARIMVHFERKRRLATDRKLQVISQFVEAIRHLRWYGWQGAWLEEILTARQKELNLRIVVALWNMAIGTCNALSLDMTAPLAFFAYTVIAGKELKVEIAFPALQLFQMMTTALRDLPDLIIVIINATVAVGRIEDFMAEPDKQEMNTEPLLGDSLSLEGASFAWPGKSEPVLIDINVTFPKGLTVVHGEVAAGKTALLQALLGELDNLGGMLVRPNEPIGYCSQAPWLQSMSIRENILFGRPYYKHIYDWVIEVCALIPDLANFKDGDNSMIGENGIGLSGGQRARVALARAVYSGAKILLLDDPLSALDQQTAEYIVRNLFSSHPMREKTVVLVTHRTDLVIDVADQWVEIEHGRATASKLSASEYSALQRKLAAKAKDAPKEEELLQDKGVATVDKFIEDEHRAHGGVRASVYWEYIKAGNLWLWGALILCITFHRLSGVAQSWFLKEWGEAYTTKPSTLLVVQAEAQDAMTATNSPLDRLPPPDVNIKPWLLIFFLLCMCQPLSYVLSQPVLIGIVYTAGKNMFISIMEKVAGATFRFYDVTPVGRLMNRMTSDITVIDGNISMQFRAVAWMTIAWISSLCVIASITPIFLIFAILLTVVFALIFLRFIPTSQSLRRLEMVSLTPLMSNFGSLLNGLTTVRAFRAQRQFQDRVIRVVDTFQKMDHFYWSLQAWLMYRYDSLSALSTFLITVLALMTHLSPGLTAFVLIAANRLVAATHFLCKQYGQLQMEFVSVERIVELLHLEQEPKGDVSPPAWWPSFDGDIVFEDVSIRYAANYPPALAGVTFTVKGGSKTAIIGRTGSGKSTLALALLATVVPEVGDIIIDGVDLAKVDKQLLRTRVTFLAQDPVLFPGSMRDNLDPLKEHCDDECKKVLQRVCERQSWNLDTKIEAGGRNLSQGQRQLVGVARAVLRKSAIIILDEATASIDPDTAMQIQEAMQEEMQHSTVITIAHRLEAVRNADYCIVLGEGRIVEQGPAREMLRKHRNDINGDRK